jgi:organic radical activating enzyme
MEKPFINLSVNPWYYCNFRCNFCYLTEAQLSNKQFLSLERFEEMLDEVMVHYQVGHIDIYGGEVLLLPVEYLMGLKDILHSRGIDDIVLVTNLSLTNAVSEDPDFEISVSYDFGAREKHELVFQNMLMMPNRFNILTLASRTFLDTVSVDEYVDTMNLLSQLKGAEIKPYSTNQANVHDVKYTEYEEFVWAVINHPDRRFYFENETQIKASLAGERNAFSNDHVYITPEGKFAVLEFDVHGHEFFLNVDTVEGYQEWAELEVVYIKDNSFCKTCPFLGNCLSEHLRDVESLEHSCNGFRNLLERYQAHEDGTR